MIALILLMDLDLPKTTPSQAAPESHSSVSQVSGSGIVCVCCLVGLAEKSRDRSSEPCDRIHESLHPTRKRIDPFQKRIHPNPKSIDRIPKSIDPAQKKIDPIP